MDYKSIPDGAVIDKTVGNLKNRGIEVTVVADKEEALSALKQLIPGGSAVMNGSSTTLKQIGFSDWFKSATSGLRNLHAEILKEKDRVKQADLRRRSIVDADVFLASPNAITEDGMVVAVDATGSRTGAFPYAAKKLLLVAGAQKIVPDLQEAFKRIREYVFPLENERSKKVYGVGSSTSKWVIIEKEHVPGRIHLVLVKETLGF